MPWNEVDRRKYEVIRARYSSDMSDAEFTIIGELLPPPSGAGELCGKLGDGMRKAA